MALNLLDSSTLQASAVIGIFRLALLESPDRWDRWGRWAASVFSEWAPRLGSGFFAAWGVHRRAGRWMPCSGNWQLELVD